jgi:hypothetical protein
MTRRDDPVFKTEHHLHGPVEILQQMTDAEGLRAVREEVGRHIALRFHQGVGAAAQGRSHKRRPEGLLVEGELADPRSKAALGVGAQEAGDEVSVHVRTETGRRDQEQRAYIEL